MKKNNCIVIVIANQDQHDECFDQLFLQGIQRENIITPLSTTQVIRSSDVMDEIDDHADSANRIIVLYDTPTNGILPSAHAYAFFNDSGYAHAHKKVTFAARNAPHHKLTAHHNGARHVVNVKSYAQLKELI